MPTFGGKMGLFLLWLLCLVDSVIGTHFAYGTINWVFTGRDSSGNAQVKIFQNYAWRRNYATSYWSYSPTYVSNCSQMYDPNIAGCPLATLDVQMNFQIYIRTGPATYTTKLVDQRMNSYLVMQESLNYLALAPTSDVNWIRGFYIYDWTVPSDTTEYVLVFTNNARLSSLQDNNNDKWWLLCANIKIFHNFQRSRSPQTTGSIREFLEACVESGFTVPRVISDGQPLTTYTSVTGCAGNNPTGQYNGSTVYVGESCLVNTLPTRLCPSTAPVTFGRDGKLTWWPMDPNQALCNTTKVASTCQNKVGCFWDTFASVCEKKDEYAIQFTIIEEAPGVLFTTYDVIFEVSRFCPLTDKTCNHAPHFSPRFTGPYVGTPNTPADASYHKSVCGDPNATSCPCLRGVEKILFINAVDYDINQTVTATNSLLPFAASISAPAYLGIVADPYESNIQKTWTRYTLKWIPPLDGVDAVVCFQALDSQAKPSNGNYCLNLRIVEAEYIYVSGIIRDFFANHSDFARAESTADNGAQWVQSFLTNGKPTRNSTVVTTSVTNFDQWFNTIPGVNAQNVFSTAFVRLNASLDRFTYGNTNFLPINGILLGNDNTQGLTSRGSINSFFTYEMHTYLIYNESSNVPYTYGSSDDMWVFINGVLIPNWTLHGIHPAKYQVIDLKYLVANGNPLMLTPGGNGTDLYRVDVFYADRSRNRTEPLIQMELPKAVLCDALSTGVTEMNFTFAGTYSALAGTKIYQIGSSNITSQGLSILNQPQTASAIYMADSTPQPKPLKVLQGFEATFDFKILSGPTQGFAFVIAANALVGNAQNQLGYGGMQNLLAIEFDTSYDAALGDPNYDHIAVMAPASNSSGFSTLPITSNHQYALGTSIYNPTAPEFGPQLTMTNGSLHHVRITYAPPQQGDTSAFKTGWLRLWMGKVIKPVVEVPIPAVYLSRMLGSSAFVGFTTGAGTEATSKIYIQNVTIVVVPPSADNTLTLSWPASVMAGIVTSLMIQARDSCGNNILVGADQSRYSAQVQVTSSSRILNSTEFSTTFTTNNDGTYNFIYSCTKVGFYTINIFFDGRPILQSSKTVSITPAITSRTQTQFVFAKLPVAKQNALSATPGLYMIAVQNDGTILSRVQQSNPTTILTWLNSFPSQTIFGVVTVGAFNYSASLATKFNSLGCASYSSVTNTSSWACISNASAPSGATHMMRQQESTDSLSLNFGAFVVTAWSDVMQSFGYLNVQQTADTSLIFFASSTPDVVSVIAKDQYGNVQDAVVDTLSVSYSPVMTNGNTGLVAVSGSAGYYSSNYSTTSASTYTMTVTLNSGTAGNIYGIPASLQFLAGPASYLTSTASGSGLSNSQAGTGTMFTVQLIDSFGNQIRDEFNALKNLVTIFFVGASNSSLVVNCSQSWSGSELVVSYTPYVLGTYNLTLMINGYQTQSVAGRQMLVVPGPLSPVNCTYSDVDENTARSGLVTSTPISNVIAGVQTCIYVQSRDRFGNARDSPNDVFALTLVGAYRALQNTTHVGGGLFVQCFIATLAPASMAITITSSGTLVGNPGLNRTVSVSVGSPSTLSLLPTVPIVATAGVVSPTLVRCFDSENNTIPTCPAGSFSFTLVSSAGIPTVLNASSGPTGFITISTVATIAGSYTIQGRVGGQEISGSPLPMTLNPGPTDKSLFGKSTPPSGLGAFGGVQGTNTSFVIQCKDQYGNLQNDHNDTIVIRINNEAAINPTALASKGMWLVNYSVPLSPIFNISYVINGNLSYYANCTGAPNSAICTLGWNSSNVYTVKAGYTLNLVIPYQLSGQPVYNNSADFLNDAYINSTVFRVILENTSTLEFTTLVDATQHDPYRGNFTGLQYIGVYSLTAFANQVVPCTNTTSVTVIAGDIESAATQFFFNLTTLVAGQNYTFQVRLRDRFGQVIGDSSNVLNMTLGDVLGARFPSFPSSFDGASSTYTFTFSAAAAGSYNVWVNLTSPQSMPKLGVSPYVSVVAGDPFAANSLASPPTVQTAGVQVSFLVSLYDATGNSSATSNLCLNFNATKWSLGVQVNGSTPNGLITTPSSVDGRFYVAYVPTKAGAVVSINLTLQRDGIAVGIIPVPTVRVNAGFVVAPPSYATTSGGSVVAGDPVSIDFYAFDMYNNSVTQAALSSYLTGVDGVKFPTANETSSGRYTISLSGLDTRLVGTYTWTVQVNSQIINVSIAPLVIVPGSEDWSQLLIPSLSTVPVGFPASAIFQVKDQYGNNVVEASIAGKSLKFQQPAATCGALSGDSNVTLIDMTSSFSNISITNLTAGRLQIFFTPLVRGLFRFDLLSGSVSPPCQDSGIFTVSAGPVSGPASSLSITTNTSADASSPKTARIVFLDALGNNVDDFTCRFLGNIFFGNQSYGNPATNPASDWLKPSWTISCLLEGGFFAYYITFQAPVAGTFQSVLVLQDSGNFDVISGPKTLVVVPGVASSFAAPTDASGNIIGSTVQSRATIMGQFRLNASDAQGNLITQTGGHYFSIVCRLYGSNGAVLYSFQPNSTSQTGYHLATFFSVWAGLFQCDAKLLRSGSIVTTKIFPLQISAAVCPQFQCPDGTCVTAYSLCTFSAPVCAGSTPVQCWDGSCQATSLSCPCPSGTTRCAQGFCTTAGQCAPLVGSCNNRCATGECPVSNGSCPSLTVCPPGFLICSDALTCVLQASECPVTPNCSGATKYACAQGGCVATASDCPTRATCPTGTVLCFDGTCASSNTQCPSIYSCPQDRSFRCSDGSCVPSQASCPSQTTCPTGYLMCWNDVCASSLSACDPITKCPAGTLRCSTGDCAVNEYMCPSQASCPANSSVLCPDGSCVATVGQCSAAFGCPTGYLTCPTGSCISSSNVSCPTQTSCPVAFPILCTDGHCATSPDECTNPPSCPVASPVRCPDGSCRGAVINCPTMITCPSERPISCADGYCAADISQCTSPSNLTCPTGLVRCFYGECVAYLNACPPHTTCPTGYTRCNDGTCRLTCDAVISVGECGVGTVQCPQSNIGTSCASSLGTCPPGIVCPASTPTRCFDGSCAESLAACVGGTGVPNYNSGTAIPCPDGTWSPDGICGTPIYCPLGQFLCSNYACMTVQTDCPVTTSCAASGDSKPLLCGTVCVNDFSSNDCTRTSTACNAATPYRCADGICRSDPNLCVASAQSAASRCAPLDLCRDGTCSGACPSAATVCASISPSTPYACPDGMCTDVAEHCNKGNGCPYNTPLRCPNSGICTSSLTSCLEIVCAANTWQSFGFCVTDQFQGQLLSNRCPATYPYSCFDGTCVQAYSECTSPTWDTPAGITPPNTCPFDSPYRCANGFCAVASNMCPTIPSDYCDGSTTGTTACASGACVLSSIYCPVVRPCLSTEVRGVDGVCRALSFIQDFGSLVVSTCRAGYPYRCSNGLCATDANSCLDPLTMCSAQQPVRCPNGACVTDVALCGALQALPTGCSSAVPLKCWNGECVNSTALCPTSDVCVGQPTFSRCPLSQVCVADVATGCLSDAIVPCPPPSFSCGSCETNVDNCATVQGCPLSTPIRCASGGCAGVGQCPPTVVCDVGQVVCADGSCQNTLQACPPFPSCAAGTVLCPDKTCKQTCSEDICPAASPLKCLNAACTSNLKLCPGVVSVTINPGIPNGPDAYKMACPNSSAPTLCFDGRCRTAQGCLDFAAQVNASTPGGAAGLSGCASPQILCPDGSCVTDPVGASRVGVYCPIIPRCPANTYRCGDGSCRSSFVPPAACPSGKLRCEDGLCRAACLAYDGCGLDAPFHCANRNCAKSPEGCVNQPSTLGVAPRNSVGRRLLQDITNVTTWCQSNCLSQIKAYQMTVTVNPSTKTKVDLAIDESNNVVASVILPSGSLLSTGNNAISIEFRPVGDSQMRSAENAVHPTRQAEFGTQMTYAESLLSVAFECVVSKTVVPNFALNLTYSAYVDFTRKPSTQYLSNQNSGPDVCLAYLYRIPALRYARWTCFPDGVVPRHTVPPNTMPAGVQLNRVQGPISDCGSGSAGKIYGFVHSPLKATNVNAASTEKTWAEKNVLLVLLIFLGVAVALMLCIYGAIRLQRYRKKYLKEAEEVDKMIDEVEEMQQYGGTAGTKDDEVEMVPNIMVVQLPQLQEALDAENREKKEKELEQLRLESEERRKHLETLRNDRDNLAQELSLLQADLAKKQNAPVARPVIEDFSPAETGGPAQPSAEVAAPSTIRVNTANKASFQSVRPTKKKDL